jgi:hypothetical protein
LPGGEEKRKFLFTQIIVIKSVKGDSLILEAPILWDLETKWQPSLYEITDLIQEVGIESMKLKTAWNQTFYHHKNAEHDNGWDGIKFKSVLNGWVRWITFENVSSAVALTSSAHCVVYDCRIIGNPGHNGFLVNRGATYNLFYKCRGGKQMHTWSLNGSVTGNVFYRCYGEEPSAVDCHGGTGVYNLFDNLVGGIFKGGGSAGNTPPMMGNYLVFHNWKAGLTDPYNNRIKGVQFNLSTMPGIVVNGLYCPDEYPASYSLQNPKKKVAMEYLTEDYIGAEGTIINLNKKATFPSLFELQRKKRGLVSLIP